MRLRSWATLVGLVMGLCFNLSLGFAQQNTNPNQSRRQGLLTEPPAKVFVPRVDVRVPYPDRPQRPDVLPNPSQNQGGSRPGTSVLQIPQNQTPPPVIQYNPPIFFGYDGFGGVQPYSPPLIVNGAGAYLGYGYSSSFYSGYQGYGYPPPGLLGYPTPNTPYPIGIPPQNMQAPNPAMIRNPLANRPNPAPVSEKVKAKNKAKAQDALTRGDRFFQTGKTATAKERYRLALKSDPELGDARARLSVLALIKGDRREALGLIHEAVTQDPDWPKTAGNVQSMFSEPAQFHKLIADLEAEVQANPADREAQTLLGIQLYLSGRTDRAKDVFLRLNDRKPDLTLAAFMDAAKIKTP